jgi:hypothetical protein
MERFGSLLHPANVTNRSILAALVCVCFPALGSTTPDALAIVQKALDLNRQTDHMQREYNMVQESIRRDMASDGKVKSTTAETFEVHVINGEPIRKLVRKDGRPLTGAEARKAEAEFEKTVRERAAESPEARRRRLADEETKLNRRREMFDELPAAFIFRIIGEDKIDGHDAWHIEAKPKPGFEPKTTRAAFLQKMEGQFWISKVHNRLLKLDAYTTGTVSLWGFLAKFAPGTRFRIEQMRLNDGVWVVRRFTMAYNMQIALIKTKRGETEQINWDFRKSPLAAGNPSRSASQ